MSTDAIITADDLIAARSRVRADSVGKTMDTLSKTEPELFGFIMTSIHATAGRLALFDVSNPIIRDTADEMLDLLLTCLLANRLSHERLWQDDADSGDAESE
jgi:hypothetical protein